MRISASEIFLERLFRQNQISMPFAGNQVMNLRNARHENNIIGMVQSLENEKTGAVSNQDMLVERIQKITEESIKNTLLTLDDMKTLAVLAMDKSLSNDERIELQKKMTELQFQLHENTSSFGLSLIGKSYEDIKPMKSLSEGFMNSQDFDAEALLRLADENGMFNRLHQDADIYTWGRNGGDFLITSYVSASKEDLMSKKQDMINYWDQFRENISAGHGILLNSSEASKTVALIDKKIDKINKIQEEFSSLSALEQKRNWPRLSQQILEFSHLQWEIPPI